MTLAAAPLTHRIAGDGPPLVLLNGGMMTFASWEPIAVRLRKRCTVLGFDFRGQLLSPGDGPADLAGHAANVMALLDHVGWDSAHLVGTSFGAEVAIELAAAAPERARSLVAITAMDRATPEFEAQTEEMREILAEIRAGGDRGRFHDVLVEGVYSPDYRRAEAATLTARRSQLDELPAAWFAGVEALLASISGFDLRGQLARVRCPSLVVIAAGDAVIAPERSHALAAALGAEVVTHPASGHALVAEDPEWLAGVCLEFLARQERASS